MKDCFMNKENRDREFYNIPKEERHNYRRSSQRNVLMHPMYVDDYTEETGIALTRADKGFGNNIYKTRFATIYTIHKVWKEAAIFSQTIIEVPVTFRFMATGKEGVVMESIHDQINTTQNTYHKYPSSQAELTGIQIHEWRWPKRKQGGS